MPLIIPVINHWQKLPDRFGKEINQDTPTQVFSAPAVRGYNEDDKDTHTGPASEGPVEQIPEAKALTDFVNSQFKQAAKLYGETSIILSHLGQETSKIADLVNESPIDLNLTRLQRGKFTLG